MANNEASPRKRKATWHLDSHAFRDATGGVQDIYIAYSASDSPPSLPQAVVDEIARQSAWRSRFAELN